MNKRLIILPALFLFFYTQAQTINPNLFGQNAWLASQYYDFNTSTQYTSSNPYGKLDNHWTDISLSGAKMVRFGGTDYNKNQPPYFDYIYHVNKIKNAGMIPVLQVAMGEPSTQATYANGNQAAQLVAALNSGGPNSPTYCKYWIVGNEPDLIGFTATQIHDKTRDISNAMRAKNALYTTDPLIIIGPELSYFRNHSDVTALNFLINQLCSGSNNILPYIDVFSFHSYTFGDQGVYNPYILAPTRTNVIGALTQVMNNPNGSQATVFKTNIQDLKNLIAVSAYPNVKVAVTEANICVSNEVGSNYVSTGGSAGSATNDGINGMGANSFIAGQFWSEIMAICMEKSVEFLQFWSVIEGDPSYSASRPNMTNIGYIQNQSPFNKKSTYWHYKLIASHFRGTFYPATAINQSNVKAYACKDGDMTAVLILNQQNSGNLDFSVKLNGTATGSAMNISLNIPGITANAYVADGSNGTDKARIESNSTVLLIYDCNGTPVKRYDYKRSNPNNDPMLNPVSIGNGTLVSLSVNPASGTVITNASQTFTLSGGSTYTWSPGTGVTPSSATQFDVARPTGNSMTYTVTSTGLNGCTVTQTVTVLNGLSTGIAQTNNVHSLITIVPNPASDKATIHYQFENKGTNAQLQVVSISGQVIAIYPLDVKSKQIEIDCSKFAEGIYFNSLVIDGNLRCTEKMIIAR